MSRGREFTEGEIEAGIAAFESRDKSAQHGVGVEFVAAMAGDEE